MLFSHVCQRLLTLSLIGLWVPITPPVCAGTVTESQPQPTTGQSSFYGHHAEGWYWYQDPKAEAPTPPPPPPTKAAEPPQPLPEAPATAKPTTPTPFSAAWVREMLPKYKDLAWDNPTPENVKAYFLLQRFAIDRSSKFADVAKSVTIGNPLLDETYRRPLASFATFTVDREAAAQRSTVLKKIAEKAGLFFFFKGSCAYCEAQAPLIGRIMDEGFDVLAVSMDGGELKSFRFPHVRQNAGQAEYLGVTAVPALFLVTPDGTFEQLGQGVVALPELKQRILIAAKRRGWITEAEFNEQKPLMHPNQQRDLSVELPKLLQASKDNPAKLWGSEASSERVAALSEQATQSVVDADGFIAPDKLVALFGDDAQTNGMLDPRLLMLNPVIAGQPAPEAADSLRQTQPSVKP